MYSIVANLELLFMNILLVSLLFYFNIRYWKPNIINPLSMMYILVVIGSVLEMFAFVVDGRANLIWANYLSNILYLGSIGLLGASMLEYSSQQFPKPIWKNRVQHLLFMIPCLIELIVLSTSPYTGLIFNVDANGYYHRASTFVIQMIPYAYLILTTIYGIYWYMKSETTKEKNQYLAISAFAIPPLFLGGGQLLIPANTLDILEFSVVLSLLANYAVGQNNRITRDTLTRLPNREVLDTVILEKMKNNLKTQNESLYVMMGDLDGFKQINDTYGHLEGDNALIKVADVLYEIAKKYKGLAARYGGDEFTIVLEAKSEDTAKQVIQEINDCLQLISEHERYLIQMSIGYAKYNQHGTLHDLLKAADRELYIVKKQRKSKR